MNLQDVVHIAITLEKKGADFYLSLKEKAPAPEVRDMFHRLAEDEKMHARQFEELLGKKPDLKDNQAAADFMEYLKAVNGHDFLTGPFTDKPPANFKDALAIGIEAEKDSILLYHELYQALPPGEAQDAVSRLLQEEKLHLVELRNYQEE
ncbi:MAG TPA: ferritin family protein [Syntrophomonas sp.]|nr:ferritin family protein [Syntrophomonas sp.]